MRIMTSLCVFIMLVGVSIVVIKEIVQPLPNDMLTQTSDFQFLLAELSARGEINIQTNNKTEYNEIDVQLAELSAQGWVTIVACGGRPTE